MKILNTGRNNEENAPLKFDFLVYIHMLVPGNIFFMFMKFMQDSI